MPEYLTLTALLAVLFAFDLSVVLAVRRAARGGPDSRPERLDDGRLRCPDCDTANEPEHRFCRGCVAELRSSAAAVPIQPAGDRSPFC